MSSVAPSRDLVRLYDRLAPNYDKLHRRWLRHAGGEAQVALEAAVRAIARPDTNLLDAGCGTGSFTRALIAEGMSPSSVTILDPSSVMLALCADIPVRTLQGRLEALPFNAQEFDIVTCAWALETAPDMKAALAELCRVVRLGGVICLAFCAETPADGLLSWLMREAILWRGTGQFLSREQVMETIRRSGEFEVRSIPARGPVAALIARRIL